MTLSDFRRYELGEYVYSEHKIQEAVKELGKMIDGKIYEAEILAFLDEVFGDKII